MYLQYRRILVKIVGFFICMSLRGNDIISPDIHMYVYANEANKCSLIGAHFNNAYFMLDAYISKLITH